MELTGKNVLVTGGAGFIGSHLVDRLVEMDCRVTVLDDLSTGDERNLEQARRNGSLQLIVSSVEDYPLVERLVEESEVIFHQAGLNLLRSIEDPRRDLLVSALGTLNLLTAMQKTGTPQVLVYGSTGSVYGEPRYNPQDEGHPLEPVSPYGISKLAAEKYVLLWHRLFGVNTIALRYYNVYGPRQVYGPKGGVIGIFLSRVLQGLAPVIEGDGQQERCFTYVSDVVRANILAACTESAWGDVYNVGTEEVTTIAGLAELVLQLCNSDLQPAYAPPRLGDVRVFRPNLALAAERLGYQPQVLLSEGLQWTKEWIQEIV
jgi:UDP-glucose 4-epimerase